MTNNRIVAACLLSWLVFIPAVGWSQLLYVLDFINALGFTFGVATLWRYTPGAVWAVRQVFRGKPIGRGSMLVLGIIQTWIAMIGRTCLIWNWRYYGEPEGGLDSIGMAAVAWLMIGGGACHQAASAMKEDGAETPVLTAKLLWGSLIAGLFLGGGIAYGRLTHTG